MATTNLLQLPLSVVLLRYWLGSPFECFSVIELANNIFRFVVASPPIARFLVSLGGLRHGQLIAKFFLSRPSTLLDRSASLSFGPSSPHVPLMTSNLPPALSGPLSLARSSVPPAVAVNACPLLWILPPTSPSSRYETARPSMPKPNLTWDPPFARGADAMAGAPRP
jgi:hypothetical protein